MLMQIIEVTQECTPNTQTQYRLKVRLLKPGYREDKFVSFVDSGNNAEYPAELTNDGTLSDSTSDLIWDALDTHTIDIEVGAVFELNEETGKTSLIDTQFLAYCPIHLDYSDALDAAQGYLKAGQVAIVSKGYGNEQHNVRIVPFRGNKSDSYGHDLYLFDVNGKKLLSSGNFS